MSGNGINDVLLNTLNNVLASIVGFIPRFISGLIVLVIGIIIAAFLKQLLLQIFKMTKFDDLLDKYTVTAKGKEKLDWSNILAELLRWFVVILFLIPTADAWGLSEFVTVLRGLIAFLPNVFIAVLLLIVGIVISRLVHDVLHASVRNLSPEASRTVAHVGKWSVLVFVVLVALNQLGIASDLIRIFFTGIVAMLAIAGGLAFGMGGKDAAKGFIERLTKKL